MNHKTYLRRINKMRKRRFRIRCDDLFHEQYNSHKGWCYEEVKSDK
jgi:hypothetical protein